MLTWTSLEKFPIELMNFEMYKHIHKLIAIIQIKYDVLLLLPLFFFFCWKVIVVLIHEGTPNKELGAEANSTKTPYRKG